jgi:dTDP-glucose 4,6-dehydratase
MSKKLRVLVTGADGFIGSHLTELLVRKGFSVRALTMYNSFNSWGWLDQVSEDVKGQFEVVSGDIRDPHGVKNIVKDCDAVMHLAALIAIPYSYHSPDSYVDTNIRGTLNLLQAAREFKIEKFIHTSTSEVYGTAQYVPINEQHPLCGQSPYSATKIAADQLAYSFYASFELPVTILRPFNTYGPRQSARAVIPTIISQIANGVTNINLGNTTPTRDFNYVSDTARAFVNALVASESNGEVINIGSNFEISVGETASLIAEVMNSEIEILTEESRLRPINSEVERLWADNSKALKLFGWVPQYSGLEGFKRGLTETAEWFSVGSNLHGYKSDIYNI